MNRTVQWLLVLILVTSPLVSSELKSLVGPPSQLDVLPVPVRHVRAASSPITHSHVFVSGYAPKLHDTRKRTGRGGKHRSRLHIQTENQLHAVAVFVSTVQMWWGGTRQALCVCLVAEDGRGIKLQSLPSKINVTTNLTQCVHGTWSAQESTLILVLGL
jgi:hypothetical protein